MVRWSLRGWGSFRIWVLTLMLTEVTLCVLGAGDLWVTGVTPLLRLLFGVAGPASWSLRSDEPVLPLKKKEYSDFTVVSSYHVTFLLKHSLGLSPFVWLQGFHKWALPYLSSFISHCSPAFSQPGQAPCCPLNSPHSWLLLLLLPLRLLLMFSPPDRLYLPLSVYANLLHPSRPSWSPASPSRTFLSFASLVNFCSAQFLLTYSLCQTA